ncbi:uncharacterized protein IUM83_04049 [Phytophthora cinnamomi]|uniref:uncharacterized protein n=1 Tax=Phytophthora cinnamomi TaxID=4785 RepID=UPI00355A2423|nr:hypothetical protein IUM83_04049 [Phytophthora cinnamomi]
MRVLDQSAAVQDSRFTTTIYLEGYQYTRATTSARKTSYRCSYYRSAGCRGKVDLITRSRKFTNFVGHTCERGENYASETPDPITNYTQTDVPAAAAIVTSGHPYMVQAPAPFQPPPINRMSRVGPGQVNPNHLAQIESSPLLFVRNTKLNFFQFNCMSGYGPDNTPNRVIGEEEVSSDEENTGNESDGVDSDDDDDDDNDGLLKIEPPHGHQSVDEEAD